MTKILRRPLELDSYVHIRTPTPPRVIKMVFSRQSIGYLHNYRPLSFCSQLRAMSWMDSWSRPSKQSPFPPPLYLHRENVPYCHTCGRVIGMYTDRFRSHDHTDSLRVPQNECRGTDSRQVLLQKLPRP